MVSVFKYFFNLLSVKLGCLPRNWREISINPIPTLLSRKGLGIFIVEVKFCLEKKSCDIVRSDTT